jgi:1,5-anhydro-D-fructose reductase (1,5-anhydro-D-mannitol-forming)
MVRIAMLGMAHVHANGYGDHVKKHADAKMTCIWDDDPARGKAASEKFGVPWYDDLDKVCASSDVDAVVINAPTSQHPEVMKAALKHKKHIFTEKALTVHTKDADDIVKLVNDSGVKFMISLPSRTRPEMLFMKDVLDKGLLGKITMMRARVAHNAALDKWFHDGSAWFADAKLAGGGALFDLGCHTTDIMRWYMGAPKSMIAKIQNFSGAYPIDDNTAAVIEFKNGALGILDTSWVHRAGPNPYEIYGTDGYMSLGAAPNSGLLINSTQLKAGDIQGYISPTSLPKAPPMPMDQWISAILNGTPMTITVEDGRNLTELLEGTYQSARSGKEVVF